MPVSVPLLRFQPEAQPGILNLGLIVPEIRSQSTLDEKMIEPQFDLRHALGKVAAHVAGADVEPCDTVTNAL
jgi:hypothetical protein